MTTGPLSPSSPSVWSLRGVGNGTRECNLSCRRRSNRESVQTEPIGTQGLLNLGSIGLGEGYKTDLYPMDMIHKTPFRASPYPSGQHRLGRVLLGGDQTRPGVCEVGLVRMLWSELGTLGRTGLAQDIGPRKRCSCVGAGYRESGRLEECTDTGRTE